MDLKIITNIRGLMFTRSLLLGCILYVGAVLTTQTVVAQVGNPAYKVMLKTMYKHTVDLIPVDQLQGAANNYVLIDTRERPEYEVSHLANATWVGYDDFDAARLPANIEKDTPIVVYCSIGYRSERIGEQLLEMGYTNVQNLHGGIFEWVNQNQPIVNEEEGATHQVHTYSRTWGMWVKNKNYEKVWR